MGAHALLVDAKARLTQPPGKILVRRRRPDRQHPADPQRPVRRTQLRSEKENPLRTLEQEVRLVIDYSVETPSGAVLSTGTVEGSTSTYLDVNFQRSEYQSLDEAAARLAEDLVSRLSEGWGRADLPPPAVADKSAATHGIRPSFLNR